eukprot:m.25863 g.25863  ORF g.25863 m.25863 type:complete len:91 (-) comp7744_c0_seq1:1546-1818(-)
MASFNDIESKKEEFRKYLEQGGVIDALTKAFVGLYEEPEKPNNALPFIKDFLAGPGAQDEEAQARIRELEEKNAQLEEEVASLKKQLAGQ